MSKAESADEPEYEDYETTDGALLRSLDDETRERIGTLAEASGQKSSGVVRPAIEREVDRREWRVIDDVVSSVAHACEYYKRHRSQWAEHDSALAELSTENAFGELRVDDEFEMAAETLREAKREHRAKATAAAKWLADNSDLGVELTDQHDRIVPELDADLGLGDELDGENDA